jgi:hypothetical protein
MKIKLIKIIKEGTAASFPVGLFSDGKEYSFSDWLESSEDNGQYMAGHPEIYANEYQLEQD